MGYLKNRSAIFIKENKWVAFVSLVFIAWKYYLIHVFFSKNYFSSSSEVATYANHIDSINQCSHVIFCHEFLSSFRTYYGFVHLSYRLFFGLIGHLLNMGTMDVFRLSFYIGIAFLLPTLIFFLKSLETDKKLIAFLLFFLILYHGGGYHGFWWVVPDFFASLVAFAVYAIILGKTEHWKIWLAILVPVGFYCHTIFVYLLMTTILFYLYYSFFTKKFDILMLKRIAFSFMVLAFFYIPTSIHIGENPYGLEVFIAKSNIVTSYVRLPFFKTNKNLEAVKPQNMSAVKIVSPEKINYFPGLNKIQARYFNYLFFKNNPLMIALFILALIIVFGYGQYKILALYFSAFTYMIISAINVNADRSLTFIWPITYLLYAYAFWFLLKFASERLKNKNARIAFKTAMFSGLAIFVYINIIYSYGISQSLLFNADQYLIDHF